MRAGIAALGLLLSGCAAVTADQCANMNWHQQGLNDGFDGLVARSGYWQSQCQQYGYGVDQQGYSQGWVEGNRQYCTPAQGYRHGSQGQDYQGVCQGPAQQAFLDSYQQGRQLFERNQYRQSLYDRQSDLRRQVADIDRQLRARPHPCPPPEKPHEAPAKPAHKEKVKVPPPQDRDARPTPWEKGQPPRRQPEKPAKPAKPEHPSKPGKAKPEHPERHCEQGLSPRERQDLLWQRQQLSDELMHIDELLLRLL
ncbi:DUF2799 domain-containing protein [Gallaecimonas kandeliae]|uniref:DUF2799 domain-containing protein n=1 Tax=Gallaecimonas kandeliae TaxID=3029055 RepID=UPI00264993F2|nr:DUF2799 domain-containing protein [Gallaecimonas kandeliae]WKE65595.1 DUF2799 domain-containing protein [Gallaecimonas kandeliae]